MAQNAVFLGVISTVTISTVTTVYGHLAGTMVDGLDSRNFTHHVQHGRKHLARRWTQTPQSPACL